MGVHGNLSGNLVSESEVRLNYTDGVPLLGVNLKAERQRCVVLNERLNCTARREFTGAWKNRGSLRGGKPVLDCASMKI